LVGASGFEPPTSWSRTRFRAFCAGMHRFAEPPYSPVSRLLTACCAELDLRRIAASCRLSLLEKGKKRAMSKLRATGEIS